MQKKLISFNFFFIFLDLGPRLSARGVGATTVRLDNCVATSSDNLRGAAATVGHWEVLRVLRHPLR